MSWIALGTAAITATGSYLGSKKDSGGQGGATNPGFLTQTIEDPLKKQVASAYAPYLAGQVGQGVGNLPMDPLYQSRYQDFMGMNANDMFDKNIYNPALNAYKRDVLPIVDEGFAGNLRGSGHYAGRDESMDKFQEAMLGARYTANKELPIAQMSAGQSYQQQAYNQWYKSLPQNNPALEQGIKFLQNDTNTGTTILAGLDPGQEGWMGDILTSLIGGGSSIYGNNQITDALKGMNASSNSSNSSDLASWFDQNQNNQFSV